MMKRASWFIGGVAAGVAGVSYAKRKVRSTAALLAPSNIAKQAIGSARTYVRNLGDAVSEGRVAMNAREDELKARRDARIESLDSRLDPGDRLMIDGRHVDAARVVVLKQK